MSQTTTTLTANQDYLVGYAWRNGDQKTWHATIMCSGTFSSGTITWKMSPDAGTTKINMKDGAGSDKTSTAADNFTVDLGTVSPGRGIPIQIYASLAGAGTPSIVVNVYDNI